MVSKRYLQYFNLFNLFATKRTREIFHYNPTTIVSREEATEIEIEVFDFDANSLHIQELKKIKDCFAFKDNNHVTWINIDGLRKSEVEQIGNTYGIHYLLQEDILSINQRPKMDDVNEVMYCLLNMLYFNDKTGAVEQEQISIVLGKNFVISFQEDASRDVFDNIREKLKSTNSKLRQSGADYLCYAMLDMIVDHYFVVMDKLAERIELLEERIIRSSNTRSLAEINALRKELIVLKRNVTPVRDIINGFIRSDNPLLEERTTKYFKDVYDHILQATDYVENYRDMMMNLHDLYISQVNLRMNEVMKVMAIVTCLMAPATVIGGVFGMNFDVIPISHQQNGFYIAVGIMAVIPLLMLFFFKRRGWF